MLYLFLFFCFKKTSILKRQAIVVMSSYEFAHKRTTRERKGLSHRLKSTNEDRAELRNSGSAGKYANGSMVMKRLISRHQITMIQRSINMCENNTLSNYFVYYYLKTRIPKRQAIVVMSLYEYAN